MSRTTPIADAMQAAAERWLAALAAERRRAAVWAFESPERGNWHYAPRRRNGVPLRAMDDAERAAACALISASLSAQGDAKARAIMALEDVLRAVEGSSADRRDPLNYSFTVFGDPARPPWGWRVEGHHLIVNVSVAESGAVAVTPTFCGANPARIPIGERAGERLLETEYCVALELARSLSADQRREAVIADRSLGNIVAERGRARALTTPVGLSCTDLSEAQRARLAKLADAYVGNVPADLADPYRAAALHDLSALRLAWAGPMAEGEPFYYRLHGPRVLIEFDCTPNDANHIHSVWRDPVNDWGRDILGDHYRQHHDDD